MGGSLATKEKQSQRTSQSRRALLLAAPAAMAGAFVGSSALASTLGGSGARVGVLLPQSERIPGMTASWRAAFVAELAVREPSMKPQFSSFHVGAYRAHDAAKQLLDGGCNVLTGIFNANLAFGLRDSLQQHNALFLVSDLGANAIRQPRQHERVVRVGPNLGQLSFAAGARLAAQGHRIALVAASFYESGYDLPNAFREGFLSAGGERVQVVVTGTPELSAGDDGFGRVASSLSADRPDVIWALYSGREAGRFLRFASTSVDAGVKVSGLASLVDGLPDLASVDAEGLQLTLADSRATGSADGTMSLFASMGTVAARSVVDWSQRGQLNRDAWSPEMQSGSLSALASGCPAECAVLATSTAGDALRQIAASSGWVSPYGA
jgi:Periplasmic binding protein